jgi:hypothetical protein
MWLSPGNVFWGVSLLCNHEYISNWSPYCNIPIAVLFLIHGFWHNNSMPESERHTASAGLVKVGTLLEFR